MFAKARNAGGVSVAHSASGGFTSASKPSSRGERYNCASFDSSQTTLCRHWGSGSEIANLPTACAVGYEYFVGFANSLSVNYYRERPLNYFLSKAWLIRVV